MPNLTQSKKNENQNYTEIRFFTYEADKDKICGQPTALERTWVKRILVNCRQTFRGGN